MPSLFNFYQILEDSWNFFRNQFRLLLFFIVLFLLNNLLQLQFASEALFSQGTQSFTLFISKLADILLSVWCILTVDKISKQHHFSWPATFSNALGRFPFFMGLMVLNVILLALGVGIAFASQTMSLSSIVSILIGGYVCLRTCLLPYHYLFSNKGLIAAIQSTWRMSQNNLQTLLLYYILANITPLLLNMLLLRISDYLAIAVNPVIAVFSLIFTYRFYTLFMSKKEV